MIKYTTNTIEKRIKTIKLVSDVKVKKVERIFCIVTPKRRVAH